MSRTIKWIVAVVLVVCALIAWQVKVQLADDRSGLFQLREIFFPTDYSKDMAQNLRKDLNKVGRYYAYEQKGDSFMKLEEYDKAVEEYKTAIKVIESGNDSDEIKAFSQGMPRHYLAQAYEKAGRYQEALEQIQWLLDHKPLDHVKQELLAKKAEVLQRINRTTSV